MVVGHMPGCKKTTEHYDSMCLACTHECIKSQLGVIDAYEAGFDAVWRLLVHIHKEGASPELMAQALELTAGVLYPNLTREQAIEAAYAYADGGK